MKREVKQCMGNHFINGKEDGVTVSVWMDRWIKR